MPALADNPDSTRALTALLAQYQALRAEIVQRAQIQQALYGFCIAANGALLGVALAGESPRSTILLASPFVSAALGLAYADQTRRITLLGSYVRVTLWPTVCRFAGGDLPGWEDAFKHGMTLRTPLQALLSAVYIATLFIVTPLAGAIYSGYDRHWVFTRGLWVLFGSGMVALMVYGMVAMLVGLRVGVKRFSGPGPDVGGDRPSSELISAQGPTVAAREAVYGMDVDVAKRSADGEGHGAVRPRVGEGDTGARPTASPPGTEPRQ